MQASNDARRRVLVFGATGFVGTHLCARLAAAGWFVGAVSRGAASAPKPGNVAEWIALDAGVEPALRAFEPHAVVNAAVCYGRSGESLSEMVRVNAHLPLEIAEAAGRAGCERFVQIDTFSWKPRTGAAMDNAYTRTKRLAGELLATMPMRSGSVALARLEFPYGPGDRAHKLVPTLIQAFTEGRTHFDMSDAVQQRDFIWIDDVTIALERMLSCDLPVGLTEIEVGTGTAISVREFVERLRDAFGGATELRFGTRPRLAGEMECSRADTSWLQRLGAVASVDVAEGCRRLAALHRRGIAAP